MKITNLKFRVPKQNAGNLKSYVDITFNDCLVIHNAKVIQGKSGLMVSMPATKVNKKFVDIVHPITAEFRKCITDEVVTKYKELNK